MIKKFYVTTPIYYPNDNLHIGHAYTMTLADYINRYKKMQGYETMFLTGSDEHGQKIADKAKEKNMLPIDFVTNIIMGFKKLWKELDVKYDIFIRTTDKIHEDFVRESFSKYLKAGFIYKSKYSGLYCKSDEAYFTKGQILERNLCPECGKKLVEMSEESYFLSISKFKNWINDRLLNSEIIIPKHRVNELINNFVKDLQDLSITRISIDWGIKINEDKLHVIYVWLDALQNYLSALIYPKSKFSLKEVWAKDSKVEILQLVGKEIIRFHCIYWPIILKMNDYREPKVLAHGWLISDDGDKMSKSKGNVVDPNELIKIYGSDAIKFFLTNNIVTGEDGKFSQKLLINMINGILVNKYSNLIARTDVMIWKYFDGVVPKRTIENIEFVKLEEKLLKITNNYFKLMDEFKFSDSTKLIINYIEELNLFLDITTPWKANGEMLEAILNILVTKIFNITTILSSLLTTKYKEVYNWLNYNEKPLFENLNKDFYGVKLNKINHLFERIKN